jgi:hypothetical protein
MLPKSMLVFKKKEWDHSYYLLYRLALSSTEWLCSEAKLILMGYIKFQYLFLALTWALCCFTLPMGDDD